MVWMMSFGETRIDIESTMTLREMGPLLAVLLLGPIGVLGCSICYIRTRWSFCYIRSAWSFAFFQRKDIEQKFELSIHGITCGVGLSALGKYQYV